MINHTYAVTHEGLLDVASGSCKLSLAAAQMLNLNFKYELFKGELFHGAWVLVELVKDDSSENCELAGFRHKVIKEHTQAMNSQLIACNACEKNTIQKVTCWFDEEQTKPSISHCTDCGSEVAHKSRWFSNGVASFGRFLTACVYGVMGRVAQ